MACIRASRCPRNAGCFVIPMTERKYGALAAAFMAAPLAAVLWIVIGIMRALWAACR
jgi:hypothetical protein